MMTEPILGKGGLGFDRREVDDSPSFDRLASEFEDDSMKCFGWLASGLSIFQSQAECR